MKTSWILLLGTVAGLTACHKQAKTPAPPVRPVLAIDALAHGLDKPETMLSAYALLNRIRLSSSDAVLAQAEYAVKRIAEQYFSPNFSLEEIRAMTQSLKGDPLKSFGETCRAELKSIRAEG